MKNENDLLVSYTILKSWKYGVECSRKSKCESGQHHQRRICGYIGHIEFLYSVFESSKQKSKSKNKQQIAQYGSQQRRLTKRSKENHSQKRMLGCCQSLITKNKQKKARKFEEDEAYLNNIKKSCLQCEDPYNEFD
jgi:hypothetical protein